MQRKRRCQEFGAAVSGGAAVLVDQAAEYVHPFDRPVIVQRASPDKGWHRYRDAQPKTTMRTCHIEMRQIGSQHSVQLPFVADQDPVQALRVRTVRTHRSA